MEETIADAWRWRQEVPKGFSPGERGSAASFQRVFAVEAEPVFADFEPALNQLEEVALARNEALVLERLQAFPIGFCGARHSMSQTQR